jgi:uncharacterized protein
MAPAVSAAAENGAQEVPLTDIGDTVLFPKTFAKPSFDCAKASSNVEHWICNDPGLAKADTAMSTLYRQKVSASPGESAQIKSQQHDFLRRRDQCPDVDCVAQLYRQRSQELSPSGRN